MRQLPRAIVVLVVAGLLLPQVVRRIGVEAGAFPNDEQTIRHVLNRLAYGPRPGEIERVEKVGLREYIEEQLRPQKISDPALERRLEPLMTIRMSSREIAARFEEPILELRRRLARQTKAASDPDQERRPPEFRDLQQQA